MNGKSCIEGNTKKNTGSFTVRLNLFGKVDYSFVVFLFVKDVYVNFVA